MFENYKQKMLSLQPANLIQAIILDQNTGYTDASRKFK